IRKNLGVWGRFSGLRQLPTGSRIGFCAEGAPENGMPLTLIGADFRSTLVDLGICNDAQTAVTRMRDRHVQHIWLVTATAVGPQIIAQPRGLSEIPAAIPGSPDYTESRLFKLDGYISAQASPSLK